MLRLQKVDHLSKTKGCEQKLYNDMFQYKISQDDVA